MKRRSFWMMLLLSMVTCGIYGIIWWYTFVEDLNTLTDGRSYEKPSPNFILVLLLGTITCGIYSLIWMYKQGNRTADAAATYGIQTRFSGTSLLLWYLVGSLLCGLGPLIGLFQWIEAYNHLVDAYNASTYNGAY